jgi:gliding motility-associated-like protein
LHAQTNACDLIVDAGPDITICLGTGGNLHSKVTAKHLYNWHYEPADWLSGSGLNPLSNPPKTITYKLIGEAYSDNLLSNGDFESGNIAPATSDYMPFQDINAFAASTGGYMVFNWPQIWNKFDCNNTIWPQFGNYLMAITPTGSGTNIWCQSLRIKPNTDYFFGFGVYSARNYNGPGAEIGMTINGALIISAIVKPNCQPGGGGIRWNSGSNTNVDICLQNYGSVGPRYICAVDNISVREICFESDSVTVYVGDPLDLKLVPPEEINCRNKKVTLDASMSTQGPTYQYRWFTGDGWILGDTKSLIIEVSAPGTYILKASNGFCNKELLVVVKGNITPPDISIKTIDIDCKHSTASIEASSNSKLPQFQWTGPNGFYSTNANNSNLKDIGEYIIQVTDDYGCVSTNKVEIKDNRTDIQAEIFGDVILSCLVDSAILESNALVKNPFYQWKGPNQFKKDNTNRIVVKNSGWYNLTTTDPEGCKEYDSIYVVDLRHPIKISIHADTINCSNQQVTLQLQTDTTAKYIWTGPKGFKSNQYQPVVSDSGWYKLQIITRDSCKRTDSIHVFKANIPDIYISSNDTITCDKPFIQISGGSNTPNTIIEWTTPTGTIKNQNTLQAFDSGNYILTVTDLNGCSLTRSIQIAKDVTAPFLFGFDYRLDCKRDQATLFSNASDIRSYSWSGPNNFTSNLSLITISNPGTYVLTATGMNGCQSTAAFNIDEDKSVPDLQIYVDTLNCNHSIVIPTIISNTPNVVYEWTGPNNYTSTQKSPSIDIAGTYIISATGDNGCTTTKQITITSDFARPIINALNDTLTCKKDSIVLNASKDKLNAHAEWTGPGGFQSNQINPFIKNPGNYQLIVTNTNGCKDTADLIIYQANGKPDLSSNNDTLNCAIRSADLVANSSRDSLTYFWTGPNGFNSSTKNITVGQAGNYSIRITTDDGCFSLLNVEVVEDTAKPDLQLIADTLDCLKTQTNLLFNSKSKLISLQWNGPNNFNSNQKSPLIALGGDYTLNIKSANQCTEQKIINILQDTIRPKITTNKDSINCIRREIDLIANVFPANLVGEWILPNLQKTKSNLIKTKVGGDFTFDVIGDNHCLNSVTINISVDTLIPDLLVKDDTINCYFPFADLNAFSKTTGVQYQWSGPNNYNSNKAINSIQNAGNYLIKVTALNGCTHTDDATITIDTSKPELITTADSIDCIRTVATLNSISDNGIRTFTWLNKQNQIISTTQTLKTKQAGNYYAEVLNPFNGCLNRKLQTVIQDSFVITDVIIDPVHPVCGNTIGSAQILKILGGHQNIKYSIDQKKHFTSNPNFNNLPIGLYTLNVIDEKGCEFQKDFEIVELPFIETDLVPEIKLTLGDSSRIDLEIFPDRKLIKSIEWNPSTYLSCDDCEDPVVTALVTTEYQVIVIDTNGCKSVQRIRIVVETPKIWVPNVFSPNNDNINDQIWIHSSKAEVTMIDVFQIFDRWGNRVFENYNFQANDAEKGWDGNYQGEKCNPGVYVYWAEVKLIDGQKWIVKGDVTLIR